MKREMKHYNGKFKARVTRENNGRKYGTSQQGVQQLMRECVCARCIGTAIEERRSVTGRKSRKTQCLIHCILFSCASRQKAIQNKLSKIPFCFY